MHTSRPARGKTVYRLRRGLEPQLSSDLALISGVLVPCEPEVHEYCPDLAVVARRHVERDIEVCRPEWLEFVLEVIAPETRDFDYGTKADAYARAAIAEYVIFDPYTREATRLARSRNGKYTLREVVEYGNPVRMGEPFAYVIETADLPVHPRTDSLSVG